MQLKKEREREKKLYFLYLPLLLAEHIISRHVYKWIIFLCLEQNVYVEQINSTENKTKLKWWWT